MIARYCLGLFLLLCGCAEVKDSQIVSSTFERSSVDTTDSYIDGLDVYLSEQYRSERNRYFAKIKKDREAYTALMPPISEPSSDLRILLFGSKENCLKANELLLEIMYSLDDAKNMFSTILELLDNSGISYTYENYQWSMVSREYIKYLLSHISRYLKTVCDGITTLMPGILIHDERMISAGFGILSAENLMFSGIEKEFGKLCPLMENGEPKNLRLLFREIKKDISQLREKIRNIGQSYEKICSLIVDKNQGKQFISNRRTLKNISNHVEHFLNFLADLEDYCLGRKRVFSDL